MIKFASKNVVGWKDRHLNNTEVARRLYVRMRNGFTLCLEEQKFLGDYESLVRKYMSTKGKA